MRLLLVFFGTHICAIFGPLPLLDVKEALGRHVNPERNVSRLANAQSVETQSSQFRGFGKVDFWVCVDKTLTGCLAVSSDHGQGVAVGTPRQQRIHRIPARLETPTASRTRWMVLRLKYYSGMRNYICWPTQ